MLQSKLSCQLLSLSFTCTCLFFFFNLTVESPHETRCLLLELLELFKADVVLGLGELIDVSLARGLAHGQSGVTVGISSGSIGSVQPSGAS